MKKCLLGVLLLICLAACGQAQDTNGSCAVPQNTTVVSWQEEKNPIDAVFDYYLSGEYRQGVTECTARAYQTAYYVAWGEEFYHVAGLLHDNAEPAEREALQKLTAGTIDYANRTAETLSTAPSDDSIEGRNNTSLQMEARGNIYRAAALSLIARYEDGDFADAYPYYFTGVASDGRKTPANIPTELEEKR